MGCATSAGLSLATIPNKKHDMKDQYFDDAQKEVVLKTWRILSNDLPGRGTRIFLRIFEQNPEVKQLFPCRDKEGDELLRDPNFKGHASRFMQAVGAVMDNIDDYEAALSSLLNGLGRQHTQFAGFKAEFFNSFEEAIMHVWAEDLKSKFNESTRLAWHKVFAFLINELKKGHEEALNEAEAAKRAGSTAEEKRLAKQAEFQRKISQIAVCSLHDSEYYNETLREESDSELDACDTDLLDEPPGLPVG